MMRRGDRGARDPWSGHGAPILARGDAGHAARKHAEGFNLQSPGPPPHSPFPHCSFCHSRIMNHVTAKAPPPAARLQSPQRIVLGRPSWFPSERVPRRFVRALIALLAVAALAATVAAYVSDWFDDETMRSLGYAGVFL